MTGADSESNRSLRDAEVFDGAHRNLNGIAQAGLTDLYNLLRDDLGYGVVAVN